MSALPGRLALVFAGDERFAAGLAVAVHSALVHLSDPSLVEVFVIDNGLSQGSRERLQRVASRAAGEVPMTPIRVPPDRLCNLRTGGRSPASAYSRLLMPELLPEWFERAVYLDADLVVRQDLLALMSLDLGEASLGAVQDLAIATTAHRSSGVRDKRVPKPYFNSGVLVIDLPKWRRLGLSHKALEYAAASPQPLPFADQDALNAVTSDWHQLDIHWNVQIWNVTFPKRLLLTDRGAYRRGRDLYRRARVLHFVGPKPWDPRCETRGSAQWVRALLASGWFERGEGARWLGRWTLERTKAWPAISLGRWRLRLATAKGLLAR